MAKSDSSADPARVPDPDSLPPTFEERREAVRQLRRHGGAHIEIPRNQLVGRSPDDTIARCKNVIDWLAHIEEPFRGEDLEAAKASILHTIADALGHAEMVIRDIGVDPQWDRVAPEVAS